jgi:hypothetical protein
LPRSKGEGSMWAAQTFCLRTGCHNNSSYKLGLTELPVHLPWFFLYLHHEYCLQR